MILQPGALNAEYIVTSTEQERELFINILCSGLKGVPTEQWGEKVQNFGSPKIDRASDTKRHDGSLPEKWQECLYSPDGSRKKTVFYSLSIGALFNQQDMMIKIDEVLLYFKTRKDLALWLRPHPLYEQTLEVMRHQLLRKYRELLAS